MSVISLLSEREKHDLLSDVSFVLYLKYFEDLDKESFILISFRSFKIFICIEKNLNIDFFRTLQLDLEHTGDFRFLPSPSLIAKGQSPVFAE